MTIIYTLRSAGSGSGYFPPSYQAPPPSQPGNTQAQPQTEAEVSPQNSPAQTPEQQFRALQQQQLQAQFDQQQLLLQQQQQEQRSPPQSPPSMAGSPTSPAFPTPASGTD